MSSLPWYKDGLRFKCTECGKCCTGTSGYVWVTEEEMQGMAVQLNITLKEFKVKFTRQRDNRFALIEQKTENGEYRCIFLKGNKCEVYLARPEQCRTFPWWPENLNSEESWRLAGLSCEGINEEAPVVPYSEIKSLLL
jgi:Fe-S-cluster containining protein